MVPRQSSVTTNPLRPSLFRFMRINHAFSLAGLKPDKAGQACFLASPLAAGGQPAWKMAGEGVNP
jgi:hypothetical protein